MSTKKAFTLLEILIVLGIIAVLATSVVVLLNPAKRFEAAKDKQREIHLQTIYTAIERKMQVENGWLTDERCLPLPDEVVLDEETGEPVVNEKGEMEAIFKTIGEKAKEDPEHYYDLFACLVPDYMMKPLYDPAGGSAADTHYEIWQNPQTKYVTLRYQRKKIDPEGKEVVEKEVVVGEEKFFTLRVPTVTTADIKNITHTWADGGGNVIDDGGAAVFERGVIWSTDKSKLTFDSVDMTTVFRSTDGSGTGTFNSRIHSLKPNTTYFVRAYARNKVGVGYDLAEPKSFTTLSGAPAVRTGDATNVTHDTAIIWGTIETIEFKPVTAYFCWGESQAEAENCAREKIAKTGITTAPSSFSALLSGLKKPGQDETTYYFKACGKVGEDFRCGDIRSFVAKVSPPYIETWKREEDGGKIRASAYEALVGGTVVSHGGAKMLKRGVCYDRVDNPCNFNPDTDSRCKEATGGNLGDWATGDFNLTITGLLPGNTYYICAYARNEKGLSRGEKEPFQTKYTAPKVENVSATRGDSPSKANLSAEITDDGGGTIEHHGFCWFETGDPKIVIGNDVNYLLNHPNCKDLGTKSKAGTFSYNIEPYQNGLWANKTYNIRAYAINKEVPQEIGWDINSSPLVLGAVSEAGNPKVTAIEAEEIKATSAVLGGNIEDHGGAPIKSAESNLKVCWSRVYFDLRTNEGTPDSCTSFTSAINLGKFTKTITGLIPSTDEVPIYYYFQSCAKNTAGKEGCGDTKSFRTSNITPPKATTGIIKDSGRELPDGKYWVTVTGSVTTEFPDETHREICIYKQDGTLVGCFDGGTGGGSFEITTPKTNAILELNVDYYAKAFAYYEEENKFPADNQTDFKLLICTKYVDGVRKYVEDVGTNLDPFNQCPDSKQCEDSCKMKIAGDCYQGACKAPSSQYAPQDGQVCYNNQWTTPNSKAFCEKGIYCVKNACSADLYYKGCKKDGTGCYGTTPSDWVKYSTWYVKTNNKAISQETGWVKDGTTCAVSTDDTPCDTCKWCQYNSTTGTISCENKYGSYGTILRKYSSDKSICWLDRNLGATQVAQSPTDSNAYGYLFQWGRGADGHQSRTSKTQSGCVNTITPGSKFITTNNLYSYDWYCPHDSSLWRSPSYTNNPCPSGWRVPTLKEWQMEQATWSQPYKDSAFSNLKLTLGGVRSYSGTLTDVNEIGYYWTSSTSGYYSYRVKFSNSNNEYADRPRAYAYSVRCIKD